MTEEEKINFKKIDEKWQAEWEKKKIFEVKEDSKKKKFYCLDMFPYPSGAGLHMGHAFVYSLGDIFARFKRMQGFNVLYPTGYDALGLPAENAAIKVGMHPEDYNKKSIANFMKQQKAMGWSYDWNRMVRTDMPDFYKWDQWIFLKMLEKGLAYRKKAPVNWCPKCQSVLANEQVTDGKCWRHEDTCVELKHLEQWFFRITDYAEELISGLDKLDWPENAKKLQKNWIGKSEGLEINFKINGEDWKVFTTRPDTIYGVTFMVVSAQHPKLMSLVTEKQKPEVLKFLKRIKSVSEKEMEDMEKEGVFTGSYAINPVTRDKVPVYAGNFVVADYGSGMVMAVPSHDQRDWEFAVKYKIPVKQVIAPVFVTTTGKDAVRKDKESIKRDSVLVIVKHYKEDKYLCLDWKAHKWKSFVVGGIEKGESAEKAAVREVKEETGYQNIKSVKPVTIETHGNFYAEHKQINRYARFKTYLVELGSDKKIALDKEESNNHEAVWIEKEKVSEFLNMPNPKYIWDIYTKGEKAYTNEGVLINSEEFNDINSREAIAKISDYIVKKKLGKKTVNYKLRDWLISRQRYWGTPIPVVYCDKCGIVPLAEKDLPVVLPKEVKFGKGNPLLTNEKWINTKCPKCGGKARRETDTMDTFVNSSWYYLRYCDNKNDKKIFDNKKANYWCPIDQYIGGPEHITMHLIYIRFYTKFLRDLKLIGFGEPALRYFTQGIVHGSDGEKMSKSRGNVVEPLEMLEKYGADTLRMALVSFASPDKNSQWDEKTVIGTSKFLTQVYNYFSGLKNGKSSLLVESRLNSAIKDITEDIQNFRHNLAVIKIRQLFDLFKENPVDKNSAEAFLKLMHVYCPHLTEELWHKLGNKDFISLAEWPKANEKKINPELEKQEQSKDKLIGDIQNILKILEARGEKNKKIIRIFAIPNEVKLYESAAEKIETTFNLKCEVLSIKDASKTGKKVKAIPGKPGIVIE